MFDTMNGDFDSGDRQIGDDPLGRQWTYDFTVTFTGATYYYPNQGWKLTITYKSSPSPSVTPSPTPTPTPGGSDISIESFSYSPDCFTIRDEVTYTVTFKSTFSQTLINVPYDISANGMSYKSGTITDWKTNETKTVTFTRKEPNLLPTHLTATVNGNQKYSESNMANNTKSITTSASASCGGIPPANDPPNIKLEWFERWGDHTKAITSVIQGTAVDLWITEANDPDGDSVSYYTDFAGSPSSWIRSLPGKYNFNPAGMDFNNISTDTVGYHSVSATIQDSFGAKATSTAGLQVIAPNPVPIITGPTSVVESRPLPTPFSAANSYSPLGRGIEHSKDEWGNLREIYTTPGTEEVTLEVTDTGGLHSLPEAKAKHTLTVKPDLPPVATLRYPSKAIRNIPITIKNGSYSPDNDIIGVNRVWGQYDADNDGNYDEEPIVTFTMDADKNISFTATKVGKWRFGVYAEEISPLKRSATAYFYLDVINDNPFLTFEMSSLITEPVVIPTVPVSLNPANWQSTSFVADRAPKNWRTGSDGSIFTFPYSTRFSRTIDVNRSTLAKSFEFFWTDKKFYIPKFNNFVYEYDTSWGDHRYMPAGIPGSMDLYGELIGYSVERDEIYMNGDGWNDSGRYRVEYPVYSLSEFMAGRRTLVRNDTIWVNSYSDIDRYAHPSYKPDFSKPAYKYATNSYATSTVEDVVTYSGMYSFEPKYVQRKNPDGSQMWRRDYPSEDIGGNSVSVKISAAFLNSDFTRLYVLTQCGGVRVDILDYNTGQFIKRVAIGSSAFYANSGEFWGTYQGKIVLGLRQGESYTMSTTLVVDEDINRLAEMTIYSGNRGVTGDGFIIFGDGTTATNIFDLESMQFVPTKDSSGKIFATEKLVFGLNQDYVHQYYDPFYYDDRAATHVSVVKAEINPDRVMNTESQLINEGLQSLKDFSVQFKFKYTEDFISPYESGGFSFKIQDKRNMYRAEWNAKKLKLFRVQNGIKQELAGADYDFEKNQYYNMQIKSLQNQISVYVNGVPYLTATDTVFNAGTFGPRTDMLGMYFKDISYKDLSVASSGSLTKDTVIVDQEIQYSVTYEDTENDPHPLALTWWKFEQTDPNKFLNAGDGKSGWSSMNGRTDHGNLPSLDRVGEWSVTHWLKDDPHPEYPYPSMLFGEYRAESNRSSRKIIVHRRPISRFTLILNGNGTISWIEQGYDPDRWLSASNYSTESSSYATNRGIFGWKYKYVTPSGLEVEGKLTRPSETGTYIVSEAVMDEYGTWSDWFDQTITTNIPVQKNDPPIVDFESPAQVYRDELIQLINKSYDPEGGALSYKWTTLKPPYTTTLSTAKDPTYRIRDLGLGKDAVSPTWFIELTATDNVGQSSSKTKPLVVLNHIPTTSINGPNAVLVNQTHSYTSGGWDQDSEDVGHLSYAWTVAAPDGSTSSYSTSAVSLTFSQGGTYKLEHQVTDPVGDSSGVVTLLVDVDDNKPPVPGFTMLPNPAYRGQWVSITSTASDPDGIIAKHAYTIIRPDNTTQPWTTLANWFEAFDTLGNYTIHQRVEDNKGAAAETSQILQVVNQLPKVELTTPSGPDQNHPSVNIPPFSAQWSYSDGDGDAQQAYHFVIREAATQTVIVESQGSNAATSSNVGTGSLIPGKLYEAIVSVSDGYDWVDSLPHYFLLNRPPVAGFDWLPRPVYEWDTVTITNTSTDPDAGDKERLSNHWQLTAPDGQVRTYDTVGITETIRLQLKQKGNYTVTLTTTDPNGGIDTITKTIPVLNLGISGQVNHTVHWEEYRQKWNNAGRSARSVTDFWAGEAFDLAAAVTDTGTSQTKPDTVLAELLNMSDYVFLESSNNVSYTGNMANPAWTHSLNPGIATIRFTVTWSNGLTEYDDVSINIVGNIYDVIKVQTRQ